MKRRSNADKVITGCLVGNYYGTKADRLRFIDGTIYDTNTPIGKFVEEYSELDDEYKQFVVLTRQDFKSQPSWKTHKKALAKSANEQGIPVVFVPQLDMGFGEWIELYANEGAELTKLMSIAKYSTDPDIKTACVAVNMGTDDIIAYSYNQEIDGEMMHAEKILADYLSVTLSQAGWMPSIRFISLLEPCYHCLKKMIEANGAHIAWAHNHKPKWNTESYWELVDDIHNKEVLSHSGKRIRYYKVLDERVDKFYNKEDKHA